jgi:hypothetical protein
MRFSPVERQQKIEAYGRAHTLLVECLKQFPREMWMYQPAPDQWSIHEILIHITDSEANSYVRCRRFVAEPGSTLMGYDEMRWAAALDYHAQSTGAALELFKWLRHSSYQLIKTLPVAVWANTAQHTESGPMTMDDWLEIYTRHIPDHLAQMQTVLAAWQAQQA